MKKKFSFVLAVLMIVCTLSIALVACAPKDPDPFTAPVSTDAYNEIWNAWTKTNSFNSKTLGLDLSVDAKNTKNTSITDLTIKVQVGLDGISGSDKEVIRLAIIDNNKKDDIIDLAINKDGLYFDALGMEKALLFPELSLPALGVGDADVMKTIKTVYDGLFSLIGTDVTVDPVLADKKAKLYDVNYTFGWDFSVLTNLLQDVDGLLAGLGGGIPTELVDIIKQVVPVVNEFLDGLDVNFTVKTTGNTQTKVKKPAKGAPKYSYAGGIVNSISATGSKGDYALNIGINGLKLLNTVPTIEVPSEANLVEASLLKHKITGEINLRGEDDSLVSNYTYQINLEFSAKNILTTVKDCVTSSSVTPLLNNMFKEQDGKLYIDVYHNCADTCKVTHAKGKFDGSIISVAFSPADFENNRIYVALNLGTILPHNFENDVIGVPLTISPDYYTQFSFDFLQYMDLVDMRANGVKADTPALAGISTMADGATEEPKFEISDMISKIIAGLKNDQELQIEIDDVSSILDMVYEQKNEQGEPILDDGTYWTILKAVNSLFKNVKTLAIDAVYTNGLGFEANVLELYSQQNATTPKNFGGTSVANGNVIKGTPTFDKDANGNVKLYMSGSNSTEPTLFDLLYGQNNEILPISYEEVMSLVDKDASGDAGKVKYTFTDLFGQEITTYSKIIEIVGLDKTKVGVEQEIALVLFNGSNGYGNNKAGIGSNINNLFPTIGIAVSAVKGLTAPELVVKTKITLAEVEKDIWDQSKVEGITTEQIYNSEKTYVYNTDMLHDYNNLSFEYSDGRVKSIADIKASNSTDFIDNKTKKLKARGPFALEFSAYDGLYTNKISVKMDDEAFHDKQTIKVVLNDNKAEYSIGTSLRNNLSNANMSMNDVNNIASVEKFNNAYGSSAVATIDYSSSGYFNGTKYSFAKSGEYAITLVGKDMSKITVTFEVEDGLVEKFFTGTNKTYSNIIGNWSYTKEAVESAVNQFNNIYENKAEAFVEESGAVKFVFIVKGTYDFDFIDSKNAEVTARFIIEDANTTISGNKLNENINIDLKEQFAEIEFAKEDITEAVNTFNTSYKDKAILTFANDKLTLVLYETNGTTGFVFNIIGTNKESAKLTIKAVINSITKECNLNDEVIIAAEEIGVPFTKELAEQVANTWNNNATNKVKMNVAVIEEDGAISFKFTMLQAGEHSFTLTNKCSMKFTVSYEAKVTGEVGTQLVLTKVDLKHSISYAHFNSSTKDFNAQYEGKATVANDRTPNLTFNFTEGGTYTYVCKQLKIVIVVTAPTEA